VTFKKKKGHAYCVECDFDASSNDIDDDDDKKNTKKKTLASIAINNEPSLFDTPSSCFVS
jgi:hypothetical protein